MHDKNIKVYKGKKSLLNHPKIIAFDLDETIGSFGDLYFLWNGINTYISHDYKDYEVFRELLVIYPEFLRYGILSILDFLKHKKKIGECSQIFLYTNNQCNEIWIDMILQYIGEKIGENIFDKTICAFKKNGVITNNSRTGNTKTYADFIKCSMISKTSEICFIDNTYYEKMINERVFYIQPKSYEHSLSTDEIIDRFISKWSFFQIPLNFESTLYEWFLMNNAIKKATIDETKISLHLAVSQKIMYYLKEFFLVRSQRTKKICVNLGRFTRKKK